MSYYRAFIQSWEEKDYDQCSLYILLTINEVLSQDNPIPDAALSQIRVFVDVIATHPFPFDIEEKFEGACRSIYHRIISGTENSPNAPHLN